MGATLNHGMMGSDRLTTRGRATRITPRLPEGRNYVSPSPLARISRRLILGVKVRADMGASWPEASQGTGVPGPALRGGFTESLPVPIHMSHKILYL